VDFRQTADILVVDDSDSVAALIREALRGLVRSVSVARNGGEALERSLADPPDLVLLDHRLPDMTGVDVIRTLADQGLMVPFVTITGHGDEKVAVEMMKLGAHDYLIKDENFLDLLPAVVRQVLNHLQMERRLKVAEEELATEELRYRELFDQISSGVAVMAAVDEEGSDFEIIDFNSAAVLIHQVPREEAVGRKVREVCSGLGEECLAAFRQVWTSGKAQRLPEAFYRDGRASNWLECYVYRLPSQEIVVIFDDISERKAAESALRAEEQNYRNLYNEFQTLLNGIPDYLSLLSPDLRVVWANRSFAGRFSNPVENRYCYELWCKKDEPCKDCPSLECFRTGKSQECLRNTDGRVYGFKAFPLKNDTGEIVNVINIFTDITEKLRLRAEANRASRLASLGELAAGVAHEVNNPNALILLNSPVLEEIWSAVVSILDEHFRKEGDFMMGGMNYSRLRGEIPRLQSEIGDAARRIKIIVDDLKNFVRRGEGEDRSEIDLNEVARKAVRMVGNTLKKATHHFAADYQEELPTVSGHFGRLEQVVVNLLLNACQALPSADRTIALATRLDRDGQRVILEVRDEGDGIAPADLTKVTDPFFTTRRKSGGTGLGLSVSARITQEHGGSLKFSSQQGKGTVVTLTLPALPPYEETFRTL